MPSNASSPGTRGGYRGLVLRSSEWPTSRLKPRRTEAIITDSDDDYHAHESGYEINSGSESTPPPRRPSLLKLPSSQRTKVTSPSQQKRLRTLDYVDLEPQARTPSSAIGSYSSPDGNHLPRLPFTGNASSVTSKEIDRDTRALQLRFANTATITAAAISGKSQSSPIPARPFPPAVKARLYSTPQPTRGSRPSRSRVVKAAAAATAAQPKKKFEQFGFVSAALLVPETPIAKRRKTTTATNPASAITTTTPISTAAFKLDTALPGLKLGPKTVDQADAGAQKPEQSNNTPRSLPRMTRSVAKASAVPVAPISSPVSKCMKQELKGAPNNTRPTLPQTPQRLPTTPKQQQTRSIPPSSIGSYGDPYEISSDSDSDSDGNEEQDMGGGTGDGDGGGGGGVSCGNSEPDSGGPMSSDAPQNVPLRVKSFAHFEETHETASDVEAILNELPAWLDSPNPSPNPSPIMPRSDVSVLAPTPSRPNAAVRSAKRSWHDRCEDMSATGQESPRRVLFSLDDGSRLPAAVAPGRDSPPLPERNVIFAVSRSPPADRTSSPPPAIRTSASPDTVTDVNADMDADVGSDVVEQQETAAPCADLDDQPKQDDHDDHLHSPEQPKEETQTHERVAAVQTTETETETNMTTGRHRNQRRKAWRSWRRQQKRHGQSRSEMNQKGA